MLKGLGLLRQPHPRDNLLHMARKQSSTARHTNRYQILCRKHAKSCTPRWAFYSTMQPALQRPPWVLPQCAGAGVLAPPDGSHTRLLGHLLHPDGACASEGAIPGMTGHARALGAQWSATIAADGQWREWRLRQDVDSYGRWRLGASRKRWPTRRHAENSEFRESQTVLTSASRSG